MCGTDDVFVVDLFASEFLSTCKDLIKRHLGWQTGLNNSSQGYPEKKSREMFENNHLFIVHYPRNPTPFERNTHLGKVCLE